MNLQLHFWLRFDHKPCLNWGSTLIIFIVLRRKTKMVIWFDFNCEYDKMMAYIRISALSIFSLWTARTKLWSTSVILGNNQKFESIRNQFTAHLKNQFKYLWIIHLSISFVSKLIKFALKMMDVYLYRDHFTYTRPFLVFHRLIHQSEAQSFSWNRMWDNVWKFDDGVKYTTHPT